MPVANLLERRCKPDGIERAFDLGDKTEMHGKGQRVEIKESLAIAERADKSQFSLLRRPRAKCLARRSVVHCHYIISAATADDELAIDGCILRGEALEIAGTLRRHVARTGLAVADRRPASQSRVLRQRKG